MDHIVCCYSTHVHFRFLILKQVIKIMGELDPFVPSKLIYPYDVHLSCFNILESSFLLAIEFVVKDQIRFE